MKKEQKTMDKKNLFIRSWEVANDLECWFAPMTKALANVDECQAKWKPEIDGFNSIWEIVSHLVYYKENFLCRLENQPLEAAGSNEDTFSAAKNQDESWQKTLTRLLQANQKIKNHLIKLNDSDFENPLPKTTIGAQVLDLAMHDAYHAGQIVIIRKLNGGW